MKDKNFPNKITNLRLIMSVIIILILLFPFNMINISFPKLLFNNTLLIDSKMILVGILFIILSVADFLYGFLSKKYKSVSDYGKLMDPIVDKISISSMLIILTACGYINPVIPVICITRDIIVDTFRIYSSSKLETVSNDGISKFKSIFLIIGIILKLFGNLPFGLINIAMDDFFLIAGTILSLISGIEYFISYKKYLSKKEI